ncbi:MULTISPECIES: DUF3329 domain-containing protein [Lachnospiraceae]|uniref:DUF3329 domain-containing protein n=1 Tax=Lachnospiraceae TaxID=186803 RepID=UPI0011AF3324|nr:MULTISPECIES: DUF6056 family protein [Lachnospiraceae]
MEKKKKLLFLMAIIVSWLLIFIFNVLTPMMSDDLFYSREVQMAGNFAEVVQQEYQQYMTWSGRSVCHLILRCFLMGNKMVFNIFNSLVFVGLALLIYLNIEGRKKNDIPVYLLTNLLIWMFGVVFRQTVLWETGACNYLWGSAIILAFLTLYRSCLKKSDRLKKRVVWVVLLFITGIIAGWCNENTSGGGILMSLMLVVFWWYDNRDNKKPAFYMVAGIVGQLTGFLFMIMAPGNVARVLVQEEEHTGLFALVSRFQKIILAIKNNFLILLIIILLLFIIVLYQKHNLKNLWKDCRNGILWLIAFLATCFALILTPEPMPRAYFGAGIFLIIAVVQFFVYVKENEIIFRSLKTGMISVMCLIMFFTYMESGANLARIYREYHERDVYLTEQAENGVKDVTVPMLRPDFETKYSDGYNSDITASPEYWLNIAYATYYGFDSVSGVPREDWTEY